MHDMIAVLLEDIAGVECWQCSVTSGSRFLWFVNMFMLCIFQRRRRIMH